MSLQHRRTRRKRQSRHEHEVVTRVRHEERVKPDNHVHPATRLAVFDRDGGCIALRYDPSHRCFGRLTPAHVPEADKNALGMKPPSDIYHLVAECLGANSGGTDPWSETHRDIERAHLAKHYPAIWAKE